MLPQALSLRLDMKGCTVIKIHIKSEYLYRKTTRVLFNCDNNIIIRVIFIKCTLVLC